MNKGLKPQKRPKSFENRADITEQMRVEESLRRGKEELKKLAKENGTEEALSAERLRFQTLAEGAPFGMVLIDPGDQFIYINPKFKELFGYDLEEIPNGKTWFKKANPGPDYGHQVI